jgi:N-acetylglutamate synthase-like GNAT family acetyltransferase
LKIRSAKPDEHEILSALALRSKAHWGYSEKFIETCVDELTITAARVETVDFLVAEEAGEICGMAGIAPCDGGWEVCNMFVEPERIGTGVGGILISALLQRAHELGIRELQIDADPNARPFYERMGAVFVQMTPSGSVPGREIPQLRLTL